MDLEGLVAAGCGKLPPIKSSYWLRQLKYAGSQEVNAEAPHL
jgi:hypothetical protein